MTNKSIRDYINLIENAQREGVAEGRFDEPLTGWHIVYRNSGNPVHGTPSFETQDQAQKYLMTRMFANHHELKVVHTAGVGVAEGIGNFAKAIGNLHGWGQVNSNNPDVEIYEFDDREGGFYAEGTVYHNTKTGRVKIEFEDKMGEYGGMNVNDTFNSIGDAMNVLRQITIPIRQNTGKAQNFDRLGGREVAGPNDVYKTDRAGKKGTLTKSRMDTMKMSSPYRKTGPKGVLPEQGVAEGFGQKPTITYKDLTLQYDYQTEDDDPEGYSTATTYYFDVLKDGNRVGEAEYFDYFGDLTIRINGKTKKFEHTHPLASQVSQLVSSLPSEQKKDLSDPKFESQGVAEDQLEETTPEAIAKIEQLTRK